MARKTATYIHCDGPGCKVFFEAAKDSGIAPEGWCRVINEHEGRYDSHGGEWEFHSTECLAKWARMRKGALEGKEVTTRSSGRSYDRSIADKQLDDALQVFLLDPEQHLTVTEVAELADLNKHQAQRRVEELVMKGQIFQTEPRRGPFGAKYRVNT